MRPTSDDRITSLLHIRALPIAALLLCWTVTARAQAPTAREAAQTPQPLPAPSSPVAAWIKGEGFRIQSPDGNWRLRIGTVQLITLQIQLAL